MSRSDVYFPRRGNALTRAFGRAVLAGLGWRLEGQVPNVPKCVVIVAPHTAAWDLIVCLAAKVSVGVTVHWLGKHTIFWRPLSWLLQWMGGVPIDRSRPGGAVEQAVSLMNTSPTFFLGLSPEGTRKRVERWKTGFYRIATAAKVPIASIDLDYGARTVRIHEPFVPTGDMDADVAQLRRRCRADMARYPELFAE